MVSRNIVTERSQGTSWCTGFRNEFEKFDILATVERTQKT